MLTLLFTPDTPFSAVVGDYEATIESETTVCHHGMACRFSIRMSAITRHATPPVIIVA
jgi:hypothetical protein